MNTGEPTEQQRRGFLAGRSAAALPWRRNRLGLSEHPSRSKPRGAAPQIL